MTDDRFQPDPTLDFLFAEAKLGIEMEQWLATDVGRYVLGRAEGELREIQAKLLSLPVWQQATAQELQLKAKMFQNLLGWLSEAIDNGKQSESALEEAESVAR